MKTKEEYIDNAFYEVKIKFCQGGTHSIGSYLQGTREKYGLKHRVTSTIHACMDDTLNKVALKMKDEMFELWNKGQIIVTLTRKNIWNKCNVSW